MKNKKILIIALFLILFCLLGYSKSFASSTLPPTNVDDYEYYFIFKITETNDIILVKCDSTNFVVGHGRTVEDCTVFYVRDINCNYYVFNSDSWVSCDISNYADKDYRSFSFSPSSKFSMIESNFTISYDDYWKEKTGGDFFQPAPLTQGIVAQQVEQIRMTQILQEIITLLPLILVVMVSLVGLRKGLKMLETFLHQS